MKPSASSAIRGANRRSVSLAEPVFLDLDGDHKSCAGVQGHSGEIANVRSSIDDHFVRAKRPVDLQRRLGEKRRKIRIIPLGDPKSSQGLVSTDSIQPRYRARVALIQDRVPARNIESEQRISGK